MGGGIGSRFWPFSRESKPKQFLDFFGTGRSLLQMTYDRFAQILPVENIFIVTNEAYEGLVKKDLPGMPDSQILYEPIRRNTGPCIAYATYHIQAINPKANIVVAPSDHLILNEQNFLETIQRAFDFVENNEILLTLGITPSRPETGYGYIQLSDEEVNGIPKVKVFTEKPDFELAKVFYESGEFLWNSGLFIWNVKTIVDALHTYLPDVTNILDQGLGIYNTPYEKKFIEEKFPSCPNISIDYGIMEKVDNACVMAAEFGWSDLGTWGSLHEISEKDENLNAGLICNSIFVDSSDNMVAAPCGKLVVIQGLEGYIVAESDDVLLICKKDEEQRIKTFVADAKLKFGNEYI